MNKIARLSLVVSAALSIGLGFAAGANAFPYAKNNGATLQDLGQASSPEIAAAEQRVEQARAQVDLANKQVNASRALLKAAQADLKAAVTEVQALKLSATAQGLVEATGMTPAKAAPVAIAAKGAETKDNNTTSTTTTPTITTAAPAPAATPAPTPGDINSINTGTISDPPAEPIQLR
jgi:hypothetical protein